MLSAIPKAQIVDTRVRFRRLIVEPGSYHALSKMQPQIDRLAESPRRRIICEAAATHKITRPLHDMGLAPAFNAERLAEFATPLADAVRGIMRKLQDLGQADRSVKQGYYCKLAVRARTALADAILIATPKNPFPLANEVFQVVTSGAVPDVDPTDYNNRMGSNYDDLLRLGVEIQLVSRGLVREDRAQTDYGNQERVDWWMGFGIPKASVTAPETKQYVFVMNLLTVLEAVTADYAMRALTQHRTENVSETTRGWASIATRVLDAIAPLPT